jgi:hypothetical protein
MWSCRREQALAGVVDPGSGFEAGAFPVVVHTCVWADER